MKHQLILTLFVAVAAFADEPLAIQDNSFLIEEAYNQDANVVQHIFTYERTRDGSFEATFTQEWPAGSVRNQLSYTIPYSGKRIDDAALNYRYQLAGDANARLAIAPRLSYLVHDHAAQLNVPVSLVLSPCVVTHWNAGVTVSHDETTWSGGGSIIVAALPKVHLMLEALRQSNTTTVSPGVRWAYDLPHGLQIVPGLAMPIDTRTHDRSLFLYLSFEHPFRR
jgi:hypothetical protein